jgi:hypothetical protein
LPTTTAKRTTPVEFAAAPFQSGAPTVTFGEAPVGGAKRDEFVRIDRGAELEVAVVRKHVEPPPQVAFALDKLAQPLSPVAHQHPTPLKVHGGELRHQIRTGPSEDTHDTGFVSERGMLA